MSNHVKAWHFVGATLRDGRPIPRDGRWLVHHGEAIICESGLHASRRPAHALEYAPGPVLCLVECDDITEEHDDKLVCRRRRIVQRADITETLRFYARMQALSVIHLYDSPADVVLEYLATGDESIMAAACDAACDAAMATAMATASGAAWAAAWAAAWSAARAAARAADMAADMAAAWAAARAAAKGEFDALVYEQFGDFP